MATFSAEQTGVLFWKKIVMHSRWAKEQFFYWDGEFEAGPLTLEEQENRLQARVSELGAGGDLCNAALVSLAALSVRFEWVLQGAAACFVCLQRADGVPITQTSVKSDPFAIRPGTLPICTACRRVLQIQVSR